LQSNKQTIKEIHIMQTAEMQSTNGLTNSSVDVLTQLLADENVFLMKLRNFHWNVAGPHFRQLHTLFEEQYDALAIRVDQVAERIRALGSHATGTMAEYLQRSTLREHPGSFPAAHQMLHDALADHESIIRSMAKSITPTAQDMLDLGTTDLLTNLIQDHEKMAWALRATLSDNYEDPHRYPVLYE
jgi:starvation-inducible DNA-binding protein